MAKIIVQGTEINVSNVNGEDYICITDMLKAKDGDFFVTDWLRNRNTMEFLGVWERIYNPSFNYGEFATIRNQSGLNSFKISVKEFVARTGAISLQFSNIPSLIAVALWCLNWLYVLNNVYFLPSSALFCERICKFAASYGNESSQYVRTT